MDNGAEASAGKSQAFRRLICVGFISAEDQPQDIAEAGLVARLVEPTRNLAAGDNNARLEGLAVTLPSSRIISSKDIAPLFLIDRAARHRLSAVDDGTECRPESLQAPRRLAYGGVAPTED